MKHINKFNQTILFKTLDSAATSHGTDHLYILEINADSCLRTETETFIKESYFKAYGAIITYFFDTLLVVVNEQGAIQAAIGFQNPTHKPLFLEQYLERPIEHYIFNHFQSNIDRQEIAEIGNFSSINKQAAKLLIPMLLSVLLSRNYKFVALTATQSLFEKFIHLQLEPITISSAHAEKLSSEQRSWGSYYSTHPKVVIGDLKRAFETINRAAKK